MSGPGCIISIIGIIAFVYLMHLLNIKWSTWRYWVILGLVSFGLSALDRFMIRVIILHRLKKREETAELLVYGTFILLSVARQYIKTFNDYDNAERLIGKAEAKAENCNDFCKIAEAYLDLLGDRESATKMLEKAESLARDAKDYRDVAMIYKSFDTDSNQYNRLMKIAEQITKRARNDYSS
jgi:tetratricopeptide (TPR) repeat protein